MENPSYKIELFEGPLDLLLSLIAKNKISIDDIPISLLFDQYMEYINAAEAMDIELSSDFIVMVSELMLIKSRMLLPRVSEEEEDPRADLAAALLEYQRAKEASVYLRELFESYGMRMSKETDEITVDKTYVSDQEVSLLVRAMNKVMSEIRVSDDEAKKRFQPLIAKKTVSVVSIVDGLAQKLSGGRRVSLGGFFRTAEDKSELVSMFLAVLELLKTGLLMIDDEGMEDDDGVIRANSDVNIYVESDTDVSEFSSFFKDE